MFLSSSWSKPVAYITNNKLNQHSPPQSGCHSGERRWPPLSDDEEFSCGWTSGSPSGGLWTPCLWGISGSLSRWPGRTVTSSEASRPPPDSIWWWLLNPGTKKRHVEQVRVNNLLNQQVVWAYGKYWINNIRSYLPKITILIRKVLFQTGFLV